MISELKQFRKPRVGGSLETRYAAGVGSNIDATKMKVYSVKLGLSHIAKESSLVKGHCGDTTNAMGDKTL